MQWIFNDTTVQFDGIGYFYQNLTIDKEDIKWHTKNGKVRMGQMLVIWNASYNLFYYQPIVLRHFLMILKIPQFKGINDKISFVD